MKSRESDKMLALAILSGGIGWFVYRAWIHLGAFPAVHLFIAVGALTTLLLLDRRA
jgi:hypothetical protein